MQPDRIRIDCPPWLARFPDWDRTYPDDDARVGLAIALARENVVRGTGGPFGAAVFESATGRLVAVGVNLVVPCKNSMLHAEVVALAMAEHRTGSFTLAGPGLPPHELATSCEPCAMCLGAALWSGVARIAFGAAREDARAIGFDEGPVFPASYDYVRARGIEIGGPVRRAEARAVLELYARHGGIIYNP